MIGIWAGAGILTGATIPKRILPLALALFEPALAQPITAEALIDAIGRILGFSALAAATAATAAFAFRWYSADAVPDGVAILLGISPVALWLNTQTALYQEIIGVSELRDPETALFTIAAFAASAIAADGGRRAGDYLARDVLSITAPRTVTEVGQLVRSAGRVVAVDLPEEIDDIEGYDPVDDATREALAGQTVLLPRRLSADQLRERLLDRLEYDYGIGHADVGFTDAKTIEYLAVGSRPAGIGPTLAPGSVAVAIRGDPASDASPGDAVRIWRHEEGSARRVTDGELRGTAGDVVTVAIDDDDASAFTADGRYRVVTRPGGPSPERELVSLLRAADDTVTTLVVDADSPLEGIPIGSIPVLVLVLERGHGRERERERDRGTTRNGTADRTARESAGDDLVALPADDTVLEAGDTAYVLGRPDALRRLAERDERDGSRGRADTDSDSSRRSDTVTRTED